MAGPEVGVLRQKLLELADPLPVASDGSIHERTKLRLRGRSCPDVDHLANRGATAIAAAILDDPLSQPHWDADLVGKALNLGFLSFSGHLSLALEVLALGNVTVEVLLPALEGRSNVHRMIVDKPGPICRSNR
jgi:hypothetical protein